MTRIEVAYRPLDSLKPYDYNPRTHSEDQITQIAASITAFGFVNPILVGEDGIIIAGHGRFAAARQLGLAEVPVIELGYLTPSQRRALVIADNRIAENAGWDEELLKIELEALNIEDFDLNILGFDPSEIDGLLFGSPDDPEAEPEPEESIPEPPADPISKKGDLWLCGRHKILCGDSTKKEDYDQLFGEAERAAMVFTDPPYNVNYGRTEETRARGKGKKIQGRNLLNDNLGAEFNNFLEALCALAIQYTDGALYICMAGNEMYNLTRAFEKGGGYVSTYIIWAKNHYTLGWSDYHKQYEPILYGWKKGGDHYWCGARDQSDIWHINRPHLQNLHPTMKPVALVERAIKNSSKNKDIILDPFGGSGTTLIAAENVGRYARLIELDPKYVDVIVRRWQEATGKTATHAVTGVPFGEK